MRCVRTSVSSTAERYRAVVYSVAARVAPGEFAQPGEILLLGVRTIEDFGMIVNALVHKLVATSTFAAPSVRLRRDAEFRSPSVA
jgi:hypothetical protein